MAWGFEEMLSQTVKVYHVPTVVVDGGQALGTEALSGVYAGLLTPIRNSPYMAVVYLPEGTQVFAQEDSRVTLEVDGVRYVCDTKRIDPLNGIAFGVVEYGSGLPGAHIEVMVERETMLT